MVGKARSGAAPSPALPPVEAVDAETPFDELRVSGKVPLKKTLNRSG
jgi:hypothetical protein